MSLLGQLYRSASKNRLSPSFQHRQAKGPLNDPYDDSQTDGRADYVLEPHSYWIDYKNSKGEESSRPVTLYDIRRNNQGAVVLHCYCHVKEMPRAFRLDRISSISDENGEVFTDVEGFLRDNTYDIPAIEPGSQTTPPPQYNDQPPSEREVRNARRQLIRQNHKSFVQVLVALARADGDYDKREEEPIVAFVASRIEAPLDEIDQAWLKGYIHRMNPSPEQVDVAMVQVGAHLHWSKRQPQDSTPEAFAKAVHDVINADGIIREEEVAVLRELSKLAI